MACVPIISAPEALREPLAKNVKTGIRWPIRALSDVGEYPNKNGMCIHCASCKEWTGCGYIEMLIRWPIIMATANGGHIIIIFSWSFAGDLTQRSIPRRIRSRSTNPLLVFHAVCACCDAAFPRTPTPVGLAFRREVVWERVRPQSQTANPTHAHTADPTQRQQANPTHGLAPYQTQSENANPNQRQHTNPTRNTNNDPPMREQLGAYKLPV